MSSSSLLRPRLPRVAALLLAAACSASSDPEGVPSPASAEASAAVRAEARPLTGAATDLDPLLAAIGDARIVLLGESSHGTHEFYRERARLTQRLVQEKGFTAVAIEGDWPETQRVNRYVRGLAGPATPEAALAGYTRFPEWMWRNETVRDLVSWLRTHNDARPPQADVGFYGLDVYALGTAITDVTQYVARVAPAEASRLRAHYDCFAPHGGDAARYGAATARGGASCAVAAGEALQLVQALPGPGADPVALEERLAALGSARSVANAEAYYRTMHAGSESTWNLRDRRMAETLAALDAHLRTLTGRPGKIVVWAHNTHVGDARQTEMGRQGELNLGQLAREQYGAEAFNVGFLTYRGTVRAAPDWDMPGRVYDVRPALPGSFGDVLHDAAGRDYLLVFRGGGPASDALAATRLQRAIGVVYRPETERQSHYFSAQLARQFDAVVFIDVSSAVRPL